MIKVLAAALSVLAFFPIATPAAAQSDPMASGRMERLLRELAHKEQPNAPTLAPVTLSATIRVTGTIKIVSNFKLPIFCSVYIFGDDHSEYKTIAATVSGNSASCNVAIPFTWENVDPASTFSTEVVVGNVPLDGVITSQAATTTSSATRSTSFDFPEAPLPAQGSLTQLNFAIRL